ncbi:MAG: zinc ribbon domain-containing protein [Dehalococcoidia bacterium]
MWQIHFCPHCGARAAYSARFCGTCGFDLTSVAPEVPPPSYDYQYPYQQWVPSAAYIDQVQQRFVPGSDINARPMSAEISKLLGDLFDKRLKYNKA